MTTPEPRLPPDGFIAGHAELDHRLAEAFERYDEVFRAHSSARHAELVAARMDLSLLLWDGEEAPEMVQEQLASDGRELVRETPAL